MTFAGDIGLPHDWVGGGVLPDTFLTVQDALRLNPGSASLQLRMAYQLKNRRREQDALSHCEEALRLDPASSSAHLMRARLVYEMGLWERSLKAIKKAIATDPDSAPILMCAAELLEEMGEYGAAVRHLRKVVRMSPRSLGAAVKMGRLELWHGRFRQARLCAQRALALDPSHGPAYIIRGAAAVLEGRYPKALADLDRAIELNPNEPEAYVWRGELHRLKRRLGPALADLDRALKDFPYHLGAFINIAIINRLMNKPVSPERRQYIASCVPKEIVVLRTGRQPVPLPKKGLMRALASMKGNRSHKQTFLWGKGGRARLVDHIHYFPRNLLVDLQSKIRFGDADSVLEEFSWRLAQAPEEAYLYSHRAEVYLWVGRYADALSDFSRARSLNDALLWPKVGTAAVHLMQGQYAQALKLIQYAAKKGGTNSIISLWYGEIHRRMGDPAKALRTFDKIKEIPPFRPALWLNRALAMSTLGDREGPREILLALLRHLPEFMSDILHASGLSAQESKDWRSDAVVQRLLEKGLEMMRGNRSRWMYTYYDDRDRLKIMRIHKIDPDLIPPGLRGNRWQFEP